MDRLIIALAAAVFGLGMVWVKTLETEPCGPADIRIINGRECLVFEDKLHGAPIYAVFCGDEPVKITRDWMRA